MPETKTSLALILAIWAAGLGSAAQFAKVAVVFPAMAEAYPEAGYQLGFALSLVGFVGIVLGVVAGLIVSQMRGKQILCVALLLGAAMSLYQATLPTLHLFLLSRVLEGLSHLAIVVAAPTLIAQLSNDSNRGFFMTLWGTFFGIAFTLTALLGVPLVAHAGLSSLFIAHAAYMVLIAAVLYVALPNLPAAPTVKTNFSLPNLINQHVAIYRSPQVAAPAIGWLFYAMSFVSLLTVLPQYVDADQRIFISSAMPLASIFVSMTVGVALLRYGPAFRCVQLGLFLAIVVLGLMYFFGVSTLLCVALTAVLGLVQGASFAAVPQLNPSREAQAHANGAMAQMGNLGSTIGPPILLAMNAQWAATGLVLFGLSLYLLALASHQIMHTRRLRNTP